MRFDVLSLFPAMVEASLSHSLLGKAREAGLIDVRVHDLRGWASGRHRVADDTPYGGGAGMVLKVEPIAAALRELGAEAPSPRVLLMGPAGAALNQRTVRRLATHPRLVLLCGHYEGVDERARALVDEEISIGDYVLTGGELAAAVVIDAVARMVPGVVGNAASLVEESFETGILDHPHYTRPRVFEGREVPEVLLSGHHEQIRRWRRKEALRRTRVTRPDLLAKVPLSPEDRRLLGELDAEGEGSPERVEPPATGEV